MEMHRDHRCEDYQTPDGTSNDSAKIFAVDDVVSRRIHGYEPIAYSKCRDPEADELEVVYVSLMAA